MRWKRTSVIAMMFVFVGSAVVVPSVSAHSGGIFTIIISKNGIAPTNADMRVNDTARWINVDDTENVTHRIFVDANGDGEYFGTEDWDSGNLTDECEHDNGTKVDENCNAFFDIPFNYTDSDGKYPFLDIVSTGEKIYGNVTVNSDMHLTPGYQQDDEEEVKTNDGSSNDDGSSNSKRTSWSPIIAVISGIGAAILGVMIVFGNKDDN